MISYLRNPGKSTEHLLKPERHFNKHTSPRIYIYKSIQENAITKITLKTGSHLVTRKEK